MNKIELTIEQLKEGLKAAAEGNEVAKQEVAAAIEVPILQEVKDSSEARQLFAVEVLQPGAQAAYPVADDFETPVFILPKLGYVPQNLIEMPGEEVYVPTFVISTSCDWSLRAARDGRINIAQRAMRNAARTIIDYEEACAWRTVVPAATSSFPGRGQLKPRPAPIVEIDGGNAAGFLSKELINQMQVRMQRNRRTLTDVYVSPEDMADIKEWGESQVDDLTRREIFVSGGLSGVFGVKFHSIHQLGATGKYNINSADSEYGQFRVASGTGAFNAYVPENANKVNALGEVVEAGETQIYGFDLTSNDSLVMPIREELKFFDDSENLHRHQKQGFYGWEEVGFAILDTRMLVMGVINRSL